MHVPQGTTVLRALEFPLLTGDVTSTARVHLSAGGASPGWRRAEILMSGDGGIGWSSLGVIGTRSAMGTIVSPPGPANAALWDMGNALEVELIDDRALETRSRDAVLSGANLLQAGGELLQFRFAESLGARRWRLTGLLRGRFGTEDGIGTQATGDPALLIEDGAQMTIELPPGQIGTELLFKAVGPNDDPALAAEVALTVEGRSLRPPSPVHVKVGPAGAGLSLQWIRRSRIGGGWPDRIDVPLGEARERYAVAIESGGTRLERTVDAPVCMLGEAELAAAFGAVPTSGIAEVAMLSDIAGPGIAASIPFSF